MFTKFKKEKVPYDLLMEILIDNLEIKTKKSIIPVKALKFINDVLLKQKFTNNYSNRRQLKLIHEKPSEVCSTYNSTNIDKNAEFINRTVELTINFIDSESLRELKHMLSTGTLLTELEDKFAIHVNKCVYINSESNRMANILFFQLEVVRKRPLKTFINITDDFRTMIVNLGLRTLGISSQHKIMRFIDKYSDIIYSSTGINCISHFKLNTIDDFIINEIIDNRFTYNKEIYYLYHTQCIVKNKKRTLFILIPRKESYPVILFGIKDIYIELN